MSITIEKIISRNATVPQLLVSKTMALLDDDCSIPFIARYRKEQTNGLDEVKIREIRDCYQELKAVQKRRDNMVSSLSKRDLLSDSLKKQLDAAETLYELEDLYLPYRVKKKNRASVAREKGLEPLANSIYQGKTLDFSKELEKVLAKNPELRNGEDAEKGILDILAEIINETKEYRQSLRLFYKDKAFLHCKLRKKEKDTSHVYQDYYDYSERISKVPSHRFLAVNRAAKEGILRVSLAADVDESVSLLKTLVYAKKERLQWKNCIDLAIVDAFKRLIAPSLENEFLQRLKEKAEEKAIAVFAANLQTVLLAAPLAAKRVMAIDPALRTGCKLVCLSETGQLLYDTVIYPLEPYKQEAEAEKLILKLVNDYNIEAIGVGNGTGGREALSFIQRIKNLNLDLLTLVNESGASIYSASTIAREEYPDKDITVRGAVSIGRRLQDPLAELVKIDAKSIGVGQYQHDVDQKRLQERLFEVVSSCVNSVGVELNTASKELLAYVSGLNPALAASILAYRDKKQKITTKTELLDIKGIGPKVFEQAAGFLRIGRGQHPLDRTAVHPERYALVAAMARSIGLDLEQLVQNREAVESIKMEGFCSENTALSTLDDIRAELLKPGRDPRPEFQPFRFDDSIQQLEDLKEGMVVPGLVSNVTAFGAFIDIGVHQDGLVHISEMSTHFIDDPTALVQANDTVQVRVLAVDVKRRRISLSMKGV